MIIKIIYYQKEVLVLMNNRWAYTTLHQTSSFHRHQSFANSHAAAVRARANWVFTNLSKSQSTVYFHFRQFYNYRFGRQCRMEKQNGESIHFPPFTPWQFVKIVSMFQNIDIGCEMDWAQLDSAFCALRRPQRVKHFKSMRKSNLFVSHRRRRERILAVISARVSFNSMGIRSDATRHAITHANRSSWNTRNQFLLSLFSPKLPPLADYKMPICHLTSSFFLIRLTFLSPRSFIKLENVSIYT